MSENEIFDIEKNVPKDKLDNIMEKCKQLLAAQEGIKVMENDLKVAKEFATHLKMDELPKLMSSCGIELLKVDDKVLELDNKISGTWPKNEFGIEQAVEHLKECEGEGIIKTRIEIDFPRDEYEVAEKICNEIDDRCTPILKEFVHPQTLQKFARERIENGETVELEKLNLYAFQCVKVK